MRWYFMWPKYYCSKLKTYVDRSDKGCGMYSKTYSRSSNENECNQIYDYL